MHQILVVLCLVLGMYMLLGVYVVIRSACCSLSTQALASSLVTSGSLLPPLCVDPSWAWYCGTGGRAYWGSYVPICCWLLKIKWRCFWQHGGPSLGGHDGRVPDDHSDCPCC